MSSTAGDFRNLTPLVLMSALQQAGTRVYEPMHRFRLELPADTFGAVLPVLARLRAVPQTPATRGSSYLLEGEIPAARVHELRAAAAGADPRRGRAGVRLRPLPAGPRHGPDPAADGPQPAQPQGVPAARRAAGRQLTSAPTESAMIRSLAIAPSLVLPNLVAPNLGSGWKAS